MSLIPPPEILRWSLFGVLGLTVFGLAWWALRPLEPAPVIVAPTVGVGRSASQAQVRSWQAVLGRPWIEKKVVVAAVAPPPAKICGISLRGDTPVAIVCPSPGAALVWLAVGESAEGLTLKKIEGQSVIVEFQGNEFKLEMSR